MGQTSKGVQNCQSYVFMQLNMNYQAKTYENRKLTMPNNKNHLFKP